MKQTGRQRRVKVARTRVGRNQWKLKRRNTNMVRKEKAIPMKTAKEITKKMDKTSMENRRKSTGKV